MVIDPGLCESLLGRSSVNKPAWLFGIAFAGAATLAGFGYYQFWEVSGRLAIAARAEAELQEAQQELSRCQQIAATSACEDFAAIHIRRARIAYSANDLANARQHLARAMATPVFDVQGSIEQLKADLGGELAPPSEPKPAPTSAPPKVTSENERLWDKPRKDPKASAKAESLGLHPRIYLERLDHTLRVWFTSPLPPGTYAEIFVQRGYTAAERGDKVERYSYRLGRGESRGNMVVFDLKADEPVGVDEVMNIGKVYRTQVVHSVDQDKIGVDVYVRDRVRKGEATIIREVKIGYPIDKKQLRRLMMMNR